MLPAPIQSLPNSPVPSVYRPSTSQAAATQAVRSTTTSSNISTSSTYQQHTRGTAAYGQSSSYAMNNTGEAGTGTAAFTLSGVPTYTSFYTGPGTTSSATVGAPSTPSSQQQSGHPNTPTPPATITSTSSNTNFTTTHHQLSYQRLLDESQSQVRELLPYRENAVRLKTELDICRQMLHAKEAECERLNQSLQSDRQERQQSVQDATGAPRKSNETVRRCNAWNKSCQRYKWMPLRASGPGTQTKTTAGTRTGPPNGEASQTRGTHSKCFQRYTNCLAAAGTEQGCFTGRGGGSESV